VVASPLWLLEYLLDEGITYSSIEEGKEVVNWQDGHGDWYVLINTKEPARLGRYSTCTTAGIVRPRIWKFGMES